MSSTNAGAGSDSPTKLFEYYLERLKEQVEKVKKGTPHNGEDTTSVLLCLSEADLVVNSIAATGGAEHQGIQDKAMELVKGLPAVRTLNDNELELVRGWWMEKDRASGIAVPDEMRHENDQAALDYREVDSAPTSPPHTIDPGRLSLSWQPTEPVLPGGASFRSATNTRGTQPGSSQWKVMTIGTFVDETKMKPSPDGS
jgi:hypothetical protein